MEVAAAGAGSPPEPLQGATRGTGGVIRRGYEMYRLTFLHFGRSLGLQASGRPRACRMAIHLLLIMENLGYQERHDLQQSQGILVSSP